MDYKVQGLWQRMKETKRYTRIDSSLFVRNKYLCVHNKAKKFTFDLKLDTSNRKIELKNLIPKNMSPRNTYTISDSGYSLLS